MEPAIAHGVARGAAGAPLYLICRSGTRSEKACAKLIAAGYTNVVSVAGGTLAWEQAGLPVKRGTFQVLPLDRQVQLTAGLMALGGFLVGWFRDPNGFLLSGFVGGGLVFAGLTGFCPMGWLLAHALEPGGAQRGGLRRPIVPPLKDEVGYFVTIQNGRGGAAMRRTGKSWMGGIMIMAGMMTTAQGSEYTTDPLATVQARLEARQAVLIDVRERAEWDQGHLQAAMLLPLSVLQVWSRDGIPPANRARIEKAIPQGTIVYCHCAAGARAVPAAEWLRGLGFRAEALKQGYRSLLAAGFVPAAR